MSPDPVALTDPGEPLVLPVPPAHPRRLVYLGTPDMAVPPLQALVAAGFDIVAVVTRPDKRRGRGSALLPSPVKVAALELGLAVTDRIDDLLEIDADLGVVVAYGRIIRRPVLARLPMVNIHFSALPRWRGAAPVERAVLAGDERTGVDLMVVEEGLDTGGIYAETVVDIGPDETAGELRARLVDVGATMLVEHLRAGLGTPRPQEGETVYAEKIDAAGYEIDWSRPAIEIQRLVRVGGAWSTFRNKRFKIWRTVPTDIEDLGPGAIDGPYVGTGDGAVELLEVQPEGKARQTAEAWRHGARPTSSDRLGP